MDFEYNQLFNLANDLLSRVDLLKKYFAFDDKLERLEEVNGLLAEPDVWNDPDRAQALGKEKAQLDSTIGKITEITQAVNVIVELAELEGPEIDQAELNHLMADLQAQEAVVAELEFQSMFNGPNDHCNSYLDFNAGSGGTESQDWTDMLMRMYSRWAESHGFSVEVIDRIAGEVAGTKSATLLIKGDHAFGRLRTESGVHRLVRKSPFDANNKRHTSFSAVYAYPEIDDSFEINVNMADVRVDVFRASGAGGQHVNRTESAVRFTHLPTGIVVSSQQSREQIKNREICMKQLKAKLYELEMKKRRAEQDAAEAAKSDNEWGSQIRSYVLDDSRIKDLRTGVEVRDTASVLNGALDKFIEAQLKQGV